MVDCSSAVRPQPPAAPPPTNVPQMSPVEPNSDVSKEMDKTQLIKFVKPSVVQVDVQKSDAVSLGSGFVVGREGVIATNAHVVEDAVATTVTFADGTQLPVAGVLFFDESKEISLLHVDLRQLSGGVRPLSLNIEDPQQGDSVVALGNPLGFGFTSTAGIVSGVHDGASLTGHLEQIFGGWGITCKGSWIQTDAAISGGNSGGPLLNMRGQVVGMNTLALTQLPNDRFGQNLNFAISARDIQAALTSSEHVTPISFEEQRQRVHSDNAVTRATPSENSLSVLAFVGDEPTAAMQDDLIKRLRSLDLNIAPTVTETAWVLVGFYDQEISPSARSPEVHIVLFRRHFTSGGRIEPQVKWEDSLTCSGNSVMKEYNTQMTNLLKRFSRANRQFHE